MNKKMKNLICLVLLYAFVSCSEQKEDNTLIYYDLSQSVRLNEPEIIFGFDDRYPGWITVKDSIAIIIEVKNKSSFIALDINKKEVLKYFGNHGNGPEDVYSPAFILSTDIEDFVIFEDVNLLRISKIHVKGDDRFKIEKFIDYPLEIFPGTNLSISSNFIVSRTIEISEEETKMFHIYNRNDSSIIDVGFYPDVKELSSRSSGLPARLALNESKNRIIAGMYYVDMFSIFDLSGKRLKSVYFSDNYIPSLVWDGQFVNFDTDKGYAGINVYPTNDYCYLLRYESVNYEAVKIHLIQVDWDGNPVKSYIVPNDTEGGGFCIDEKNKKMYTIKHSVTDDNEIFYIVAYSLEGL